MTRAAAVALERPAGEPSGGGAGGQAPSTAPKLTLRRILTMLVLPASLLPVLLLGPGMLHAPRKLGRQLWADAVRLDRRLQPARSLPPAPPVLHARVSFGNVYGSWRAFPQFGREGLIRLGPEQ
ncbi:MAG TPA: hypothetical protein VH081_04080 [Solirubrobacteraceae bacterium]|nr:hypothetical protein [Solirubrobacteraceae bacterium]